MNGYLPFLPIGSDDLVRVLRLRRGGSLGTPEAFVVLPDAAYRAGPYALSRYPRDEFLELACLSPEGLLSRTEPFRRRAPRG